MCIETLHLDKRHQSNSESGHWHSYRRVGGGCIAKLVDHVRCMEWIMGIISGIPETLIAAKLVD